eukprot:TRINITY_DN95660_c0_g1_i1.p1 TRINITY_DN95660_c0_g1~~TRINITY_DN95660_c0_g1_i1.p1  ORF type:complete len:241 (+),score=10.83 TRINITY_DN95660_c0_g1_i1:80-802(+)
MNLFWVNIVALVVSSQQCSVDVTHSSCTAAWGNWGQCRCDEGFSLRTKDTFGIWNLQTSERFNVACGDPEIRFGFRCTRTFNCSEIDAQIVEDSQPLEISGIVQRDGDTVTFDFECADGFKSVTSESLICQGGDLGVTNDGSFLSWHNVCENIDECETQNNICGDHGKCTDTPGNDKCECAEESSEDGWQVFTQSHLASQYLNLSINTAQLEEYAEAVGEKAIFGITVMLLEWQSHDKWN